MEERFTKIYNLNVRKLHKEILEEYIKNNNAGSLDNLKISAKNSNPDKIDFDGTTSTFESGHAFSFIGERGLIATTRNTHMYIFSGLKAVASGFTKIENLFKDYGVKFFGSLKPADVEYFTDHQKSQNLGDTRINTNSGRVWKSVFSESANKNVSIIAFWGRQKKVTPEDINKLKKVFKLENDVFWVATDSKFFNYNGDTFTTKGTKELKSRIDPSLSHADIVDILIRGHTGYKLTALEKRIVWEFRGHDPSELKEVTGGYPSAAEYQYRKKLSENKNYDI